MTKPRISIIGTRGYPSYYGGFETAVRKLAPFLADRGWDVTVYGRPSPHVVDIAEKDPRVATVMTSGIESKQLSTLSFGLSSTLHAARSKPDVALVMNVANGFWLPILRARGVPTLVNVDGIEWDRAKWGRLAKRVFKLGARFTARWADELVFDANAIGDRWRKDFHRSGTFIPYGGDIPTDVSTLETGLTRRGYILFVARFVPENTVEEFFEAAKELAERWDVVLIGSSGYDGPLDDLARQLATNSARIHWLGHMRDDARLLSLWSNAGTYFHGHSVGGTNPALVQAMAAGAPIVARDTVYNREVLGEDAVVTAPDSRAIVERISQMMERDDLDDIGARNALRAESSYSWESVCAEYHSQLTKLVAAKTTRKPHDPHRS